MTFFLFLFLPSVFAAVNYPQAPGMYPPEEMGGGKTATVPKNPYQSGLTDDAPEDYKFYYEKTPASPPGIRKPADSRPTSSKAIASPHANPYEQSPTVPKGSTTHSENPYEQNPTVPNGPASQPENPYEQNPTLPKGPGSPPENPYEQSSHSGNGGFGSRPSSSGGPRGGSSGSSSSNGGLIEPPYGEGPAAPPSSNSRTDSRRPSTNTSPGRTPGLSPPPLNSGEESTAEFTELEYAGKKNSNSVSRKGNKVHDSEHSTEGTAHISNNGGGRAGGGGAGEGARGSGGKNTFSSAEDTKSSHLNPVSFNRGSRQCCPCCRGPNGQKEILVSASAIKTEGLGKSAGRKGTSTDWAEGDGGEGTEYDPFPSANGVEDPIPVVTHEGGFDTEQNVITVERPTGRVVPNEIGTNYGGRGPFNGQNGGSNGDQIGTNGAQNFGNSPGFGPGGGGANGANGATNDGATGGGGGYASQPPQQGGYTPYGQSNYGSGGYGGCPCSPPPAPCCPAPRPCCLPTITIPCCPPIPCCPRPTLCCQPQPCCPPPPTCCPQITIPTCFRACPSCPCRRRMHASLRMKRQTGLNCQQCTASGQTMPGRKKRQAGCKQCNTSSNSFFGIIGQSQNTCSSCSSSGFRSRVKRMGCLPCLFRSKREIEEEQHSRVKRMGCLPCLGRKKRSANDCQSCSNLGQLFGRYKRTIGCSPCGGRKKREVREGVAGKHEEAQVDAKSENIDEDGEGVRRAPVSCPCAQQQQQQTSFLQRTKRQTDPSFDIFFNCDKNCCDYDKCDLIHAKKIRSPFNVNL